MTIGTIRYRNGSYDGEIKNGCPCGEGKFTMFNGIVFIGKWNKEVGSGKIVYSRNNCESGSWIMSNNKWHKCVSSESLVKVPSVQKKVLPPKVEVCNEPIRSTRESMVLSELNRRGFVGFTHETDFDHMRQILRSGHIGSRNENLGKASDNANPEVIARTSDWVKDCARFYFYKGTPTNYRFNQNNPYGMAYLIFDWDIVHMPNAKFSDGNAASDCTRFMKTSDYLSHDTNFMDWDGIFHRGRLPWTNTPYGEMSQEEWNGVRYKEDIIRKRNAELIVDGDVSISYLKNIVFRSKYTYDKFWDSVSDKMIRDRYMPLSSVDGSFF